MREAGESRWAPWGALFATRLVSGLTCIALVVLLALGFSWTQNLVLLGGLGFTGLTYLGLAACTFLQGRGARASRKSGFSTAVVFLHSITAAISVFFIAEFAGVVLAYNIQYFGFHASSLIILTPFMAYLLDVLVMQARIRLRYRYALFFLILSTLYIVIVIAVVGVRCPSCLSGPLIGALVGIHIGVGCVAALLAVLLTRISWPCFKH